MKKYYSIIFIILTLVGCSDKQPKSLDTDPIVIQIFEDTEIRNLSKILQFFEEQICTNQQIDNEKISDCYKAYLKQLSKAVETGCIEINIPFEEQKKMYKAIDTSTFNQIWYIGKQRFPDSPKTFKYFTLYHNGKHVKYLKFLKAVGDKNEIIKDYYEALRSVGSISPTSVAHLLKSYQLYDVSDIKIRLIIAIHYLTLNDQYERKEKY